MRLEKVAILNEVTERVKDSEYCFIINHGGVTVAQFAELRKALRALDSRLLVVKNTFIGKVAKEKGWSEEVNAMFTGNTAIVTGHGEATAVAKAIMKFVDASGGRSRRCRRCLARTSSAPRSSCSSRSLRHVSRVSSPRRRRRATAALPPPRLRLPRRLLRRRRPSPASLVSRP